MRTEKKQRLRQLRHWRGRKKIIGTSERPRMSVRFTNKNIYVQFVDDEAGVTLASASTMHKSTPDRSALKANVASAEKVGELAAQAAKGVGIAKVVFDRSGARYHGKVKAVADAARKSGIEI
jgi:large subunit ribosomal protein L18